MSGKPFPFADGSGEWSFRPDPRYQAHPIQKPSPVREGLFVVRDAAVLLLAIVVIVLIAGLNGPRP